MIDSERLLSIIIQAGSFISAMAAIVASVIMIQVTKKFGTGILASGFRSISVGVLFIALAIFIDAAQSYAQISSGMLEIITVLIIIKEILFIIGTYIIVIGSKKTGDKLESLT